MSYTSNCWSVHYLKISKLIDIYSYIYIYMFCRCLYAYSIHLYI